MLAISSPTKPTYHDTGFLIQSYNVSFLPFSELERSSFEDANQVKVRDSQSDISKVE